jgi:trehalose 6-phosphate synthase
MRKTVVQNDVAKWARDFLRELEAVPERHDKSVRHPSSGGALRPPGWPAGPATP